MKNVDSQEQVSQARVSREPRSFATRAARTSMAALALALLGGSSFTTSSCIVQGHGITGAQTFVIHVTKVNGADPPTSDNPAPANHGDIIDTWDADVQAVDVNGNPTSFDGYTRISVHNGSVTLVENLDTGETEGRNLLVQGGHANARVSLTAVFGPSRLWVEDIGYVPAPPGTTPECSDGKNNDPSEDKLIDFPADPGCAYADDNTETGGTFATGTSGPVYYALPAVRDVQGGSATTPYLNDAIQVRSDDPQYLVVTRISKDGFYVTDLTDQDKGFNNLFAFNFSTPAGMQVCDRVVYLAGTVGQFFGFTELNFPSYRLLPLLVGQEDQCQVPEPYLLVGSGAFGEAALQPHMAGLVRIQNVTIPKNFGAGLVPTDTSGAYVPAPGLSNCDLNGDGKVDFKAIAEGACSTACDADIECSEWNEYTSNNEYKVHDAQNNAIKIDTSGAPGILPVLNPGAPIASVTGTLRKFSGGNFKWTIEARCSDDVICDLPGCATQTLDAKHACVNITRTFYDNDEGTN